MGRGKPSLLVGSIFGDLLIYDDVREAFGGALAGGWLVDQIFRHQKILGILSHNFPDNFNNNIIGSLLGLPTLRPPNEVIISVLRLSEKNKESTRPEGKLFDPLVSHPF